MIVLEQTIFDEIVRIGRERLPAEACGVLLSEPWRGRQVWELPNRSKTPHNSFTMFGSDIAIALEEWIQQHDEEYVWNSLRFWHTHPSGEMGPSKADLKNRLPEHRNLVVSIPSEGDAKASWY